MDEASKTRANSQENQPEPQQAELPPSQEEQTSPRTSPRKRQADHDSSNGEPRQKRARLTQKNLALFDKMAKKETADPTDGSSTTTKTTSTTTSGFAVAARKNGILDPRSSKPPANLEEFRERHARSRATASPPDSVYQGYANKVGKVKNEATMVVETSRHILKEYDDDEGYDRVFNQQFTGLPRNLGFNNGLSAPQPDFVEGLELEKYLPFPVDEQVPGAALYQDDPHSLTLPHVAGEWKGPNGSMKEAELQSAYDGAALVHGRNEALAHMGQSDPPGHAVITTFTTDGTSLNLYAHYATPSAEDEDTLEYHQYPISTTNIKDTYQGHKDGRKGLRNVQDYAKQQSYAMKDQLKEHWKQNRDKLPPITEGINPPPTSDMEPPPPATDGYEDASPHVQEEEEEDEDEENCEIVQPTRHRESSHHSKSSHRHHSSPHHSSSQSSHHSSSHSSSHKRKAPSSQTSSHASSGHASKHGSYWKKNSEGHCYHKHSDGTVTWYDDVEDHHHRH